MDKRNQQFDICLVCTLYEEARAVIEEFSARCNTTFQRAFRERDHYEYRSADLSPTGLRSYFSRQGGRIPRWLDPTVPQQVCVEQGVNLAIPIDQLLAQIREQFAVQLERYHIELDDGNS